jgi:hypothetical protein
MRQLGMPNTPSETEHQINEQLGSSDTLEGNPPQIRTPHRDTLLEVVSSASYEVKDIRIPHQDTACSVTQEPHLFNQIPILMPIWIRARAKYHCLIERRWRNFFKVLRVKKLHSRLLDPPRKARVRTRMQKVRRNDVSEGLIEMSWKVMRTGVLLSFDFALALAIVLNSWIDFGAWIGSENWITSRLTKSEEK